MNSSTSQSRQAQMGDNAVNKRSASASESQLSPLTDLQSYARQYVEEQPEMAALICLGLGFVLGWKLKPW